MKRIIPPALSNGWKVYLLALSIIGSAFSASAQWTPPTSGVYQITVDINGNIISPTNGIKGVFTGNHIGDGSALTGIVAAVTAGVNTIIIPTNIVNGLYATNDGSGNVTIWLDPNFYSTPDKVAGAVLTNYNIVVSQIVAQAAAWSTNPALSRLNMNSNSVTNVTRVAGTALTGRWIDFETGQFNGSWTDVVTNRSSLVLSNSQGKAIINPSDSNPYDSEIPYAIEWRPVGSAPKRTFMHDGLAQFYEVVKNITTIYLFKVGYESPGAGAANEPYIELQHFHDSMFSTSSISYKIKIKNGGNLVVEKSVSGQSGTQQGGLALDASSITNWPNWIQSISGFNAWVTSGAQRVTFSNTPPARSHTMGLGVSVATATNLTIGLGGTNKFIIGGTLNP